VSDRPASPVVYRHHWQHRHHRYHSHHRHHS
jgi:hypothetical protein